MLVSLSNEMMWCHLVNENYVQCWVDSLNKSSKIWPWSLEVWSQTLQPCHHCHPESSGWRPSAGTLPSSENISSCQRMEHNHLNLSLWGLELNRTGLVLSDLPSYTSNNSNNWTPKNGLLPALSVWIRWSLWSSWALIREWNQWHEATIKIEPEAPRPSLGSLWSDPSSRTNSSPTRSAM